MVSCQKEIRVGEREAGGVRSMVGRLGRAWARGGGVENGGRVGGAWRGVQNDLFVL